MVHKISEAIGANIDGVDLNQDISDLDFNKILLDLAHLNEAYNKDTNSVQGMLEITVLSNVAENGVSISTSGNSACVWHTDMIGTEEPPTACLL